MSDELDKGDSVTFLDCTLDLVPLHRYGTVEEVASDGFIWVREWDTNQLLRLTEFEVKPK